MIESARMFGSTSRPVAVWVGCALLGCASNVSAPQDGVETGACIDGQCLEGLECLSNVCVDPDGGSSTGGTTSTTTLATDTATTSTTTTTTTTTEGSTGTETTTGDPMPIARQASILFVIDNSGSMGEEQAGILGAIEPFLSAFDDVDLRVAVTTTDSGNPWCQGTEPEAGAFVATNCRGRLQDFIFQGQTEIDATTACTNGCGAELDAFSGPSGAWYERTADGTTNVGAFDFTDAVRCGLPQGINGCGFEQHLESVYLALSRTEDATSNEVGFVYPDGALAIVVVTDEVDCSSTEDAIFLPDGGKAFWSDQDAAAPTSAVCWNAGVECVGSGTYDSCDPADKALDGSDAAAGAGVLHPVSRYVDRFNEVGARFYAISGVPVGYPSTPVVYQDAPTGTPNDPNFQFNFGIGPGCTSVVAEAVPPVRMRDLADQTAPSGAGLYSVCDTNYATTLGAIAADIVGSLPPA